MTDCNQSTAAALDQQPPASATIDQRIDAFCIDLASIAKEYEILEESHLQDPRMIAMHEATETLKTSFASLSQNEVSALAARFVAAIPVFEDLLPHLRTYMTRLAACAITLEPLFGAMVEVTEVSKLSHVLQHADRDRYLKLVGLEEQITKFRKVG